MASSFSWLLSKFPAYNHAFMLREIERMAELGFSVHPIALADPDRTPEKLTPREHEAWRNTWYVNRQSPGAILRAHLAVLIRHPGGWLRGFWTAVTFSRWNWSGIPANIKYFAGAVMLGHHLEEKQVFWLHSHYTSTVAYLVGVTFAGRIRYSITIHGSGEFEDVRGFRLSEKIHAAEFVVAISSFGRSQMMKITPPAQWSKIHVVRLGIDPTNYPLSRPDPSGPFTLVTAGMLVGVKGYPLLLDAMAVLRARGRSVRLRLAGDGAGRADLEAQARQLGLDRDVVEFLGWVAGDRLPEIYAAANVFVMSSFAEGIPVVLMEAMAMGVPCVATFVGGIPELIENGVTGLLVPAGDSLALADSIERLMSSPELCASIAEAGRRKVAECYNLDRNTMQLAALLREKATNVE